MPADVLVVMARYPTPGAVKTRLAVRLGAEAACTLYAAFLTDLAATLAGGPWQLRWAVTPPGADLTAFVGAGAATCAQRGADLAARMAHVFEDCFAAGADRVVMIGADAPHLGRERMAQAFAALADHDAVLTPVRDGGYCLVGLRAPHDLFTGIAMGTATVYADTLRRAAALGLRVAVQAPTFDVDEWDDLATLADVLRGGDVRLPATERLLRDLRC